MDLLSDGDLPSIDIGLGSRSCGCRETLPQASDSRKTHTAALVCTSDTPSSSGTHHDPYIFASADTPQYSNRSSIWSQQNTGTPMPYSQPEYENNHNRTRHGPEKNSGGRIPWTGRGTRRGGWADPSPPNGRSTSWKPKGWVEIVLVVNTALTAKTISIHVPLPQMTNNEKGNLTGLLGATATSGMLLSTMKVVILMAVRRGTPTSLTQQMTRDGIESVYTEWTCNVTTENPAAWS